MLHGLLMLMLKMILSVLLNRRGNLHRWMLICHRFRLNRVILWRKILSEEKLNCIYENKILLNIHVFVLFSMYFPTKKTIKPGIYPSLKITYNVASKYITCGIYLQKGISIKYLWDLDKVSELCTCPQPSHLRSLYHCSNVNMHLH